MSKITINGRKRLALLSGRAHPALADEIATLLGTELIPTTAYDFASGETFVRFEESVRGVDAFVIQAHPAPVNHWLVEQLLMVDALKRASAKRITVVAPFFPYARGPVDHLWALPMLADCVKDNFDDGNITVVSPDSGRVRVADIWADRLGAPLAIVHKRRDPDVPNQVTAQEVVGDVEGRTCLLVDDMIDTAGTIVAAAAALKKNGAKRVIVAATHAIFSDPAVERLSGESVDAVVVTNTLPIPEEKRFETLTVLSIAPLIARAISAVFDDDSVSQIFPGHA